jgi:hypothetical protein
VDVSPGHLEEVQRERFAARMTEFKDIFEKPCVDTFATIFEVKRKILNKKAK